MLQMKTGRLYYTKNQSLVHIDGADAFGNRFYGTVVCALVPGDRVGFSIDYDNKGKSIGLIVDDFDIMSEIYLSPAPYTNPPKAHTSPLQDYDSAVAKINDDRGSTYGHPAINFQRIADLWKVVLGHEVTTLQVAQMMRLVKEARLVQTPGHVDTLVDIAGYARTSAMILDHSQPPKPADLMPGTIQKIDPKAASILR